ncbi:ING family-like protein Png3 [Schizosaccharomyces osmophilus]|uniref:ING family-like protein Png3 n=1 Tax=Schizosaccharomyces osmophilus TaxID=2545709 RepID=A0AAE9WDY5_9SCHI|nr:ING family-like protein Png3 [Schizosaccharomyces osmophilus]WBW73869.1 ING family-like protein Png3 [Schizosaccharomyces osmophilus]
MPEENTQEVGMNLLLEMADVLDATPSDLSSDFSKIHCLDGKIKEMQMALDASVHKIMSSNATPDERSSIIQNIVEVVKKNSPLIHRKAHISMHTEAVSKQNLSRLQTCFQAMEMIYPHFFIPYVAAPEPLESRREKRVPTRSSKRRQGRDASAKETSEKKKKPDAVDSLVHSPNFSDQQSDASTVAGLNDFP